MSLVLCGQGGIFRGITFLHRIIWKLVIFIAIFVWLEYNEIRKYIAKVVSYLARMKVLLFVFL